MKKPAVLVTGGANRIGAEIVRRFAADGWHCIIHYLGSQNEAQDLADALPSAEIVCCDLSDSDAALKMVKDVAARTHDWRVLVNSASIFEYDDVTSLNPVTNKRSMQINALTPALMTQKFLSEAKSDTGRTVIQVTDQKLENPNPDFASYTMSKHALDATIAMFALGASEPDDRIYGLAPGAILQSHDQTEQEVELSHRLNPLGRKTGADEVANAALFLSRGVLRSGETLFIDSGQHLLQQDRDVIYLAREMRNAGVQ